MGAAGNEIFKPQYYVSRKMLKNFVYGDSSHYISKYYPDIPRATFQFPEFSIRSKKNWEAILTTPLYINLPNTHIPILVNGISYEPNTLKCTGVEVIYQGGYSHTYQDIDPSRMTDSYSYGTYQVCNFNFFGTEISEIEFRHIRWEDGRLIAIARMVSIQDEGVKIALISSTDLLRSAPCTPIAFFIDT